MNPFIGRGKETEVAKQMLKRNDILVITGMQGIGKSKFAANLAELFEKEEDYKPIVIKSIPVPLIDDLSYYILPNEKYVLIFDDANKAIPNFNILLDFMKTREAGSIKVIATVRDYVKPQLEKELLNVPHETQSLLIYKDEQLKEIIVNSIPSGTSLTQLATERIVALAKGNSRLALMATELVLKHNKIPESIFTLYDNYFEQLHSDILFLKDKKYMVALGVLAFFGVIARKNENLEKALRENFGIDWGELWETFHEMYQSELVDIFSTEVVKMSDQVLATYAFYTTFISQESQLIDYGKWVSVFMQEYYSKITKTLIDVINTFGYVELKSRMETLSKQVKSEIGDDPKVYANFLLLFWFVREIETLKFVEDFINNVEPDEIHLGEIKYKIDKNAFEDKPAHLILLSNFWMQDTPYTRQALRLGLKLMFKRPSELQQVLKSIFEGVSVHRHDWQLGYKRQIALFELLRDMPKTDREREIANMIFLELCPQFLKLEFTQSEGNGSRSIVIYSFTLPPSPDLTKLRKLILSQLFTLYPHKAEEIVSIMGDYMVPPRNLDAKVFEEEEKLVSDFLSRNLSVKRYSHCDLVITYLDLLAKCKLTASADFNRFLFADVIQLARLFIPKDDRWIRVSDEQFAQETKSKLTTIFQGMDIGAIKTFFERVSGIYKDALQSRDAHWIESGISTVFHILADTDPNLYLQSLELIMVEKFEFSLEYGNIITYPIDKKLVESKRLYEVIAKHDYPRKHFWKKLFFDTIPESEVDQYYLTELIDFARSIAGNLYLYNLSRYMKYQQQFLSTKPDDAINHDNVVTYIASMILTSGTSGVQFDHDICQKEAALFANQADLLKMIYFHNRKGQRNYDHDGKELRALSELDHFFICELVAKGNDKSKFLSTRFDHIDASFIWEFEEREAIVDNCMELFVSNYGFLLSFEYAANALFRNVQRDAEKEPQAISYLEEFIAKHSNSRMHVQIAMNVVLYSFPGKIIHFIEVLLRNNKDVEIFKQLLLERGGTYTGSRVPRIDEHIHFLENLIALVEGFDDVLEYSGHIHTWKESIEWAKNDRMRTLANEFVEDFD